MPGHTLDAKHGKPPARELRVGMFGLLGSGNIGNDAQFEVLLKTLSKQHPDAVVDCMCAGPAVITDRYGIPATRLQCTSQAPDESTGLGATLRKAMRVGWGIARDGWRTASWVRKHDVIMVPGMGTLENALQHRPWEMPYSLFLLALFGKLFNVRVAFVCVGASHFPPSLTRHMMTASARMAYFRSFRDEYSRNSMRDMGVDVSHDDVFQDLVHAQDTADAIAHTTRTVGLGVMAYYGDNCDRSRADAIHASYVDKITEFAQWLVDNGYEVRLLIGDNDDEPVALELQRRISALSPDAGRAISYEPTATLSSLLHQIASVDAVVATRYHNVLCALHCNRPTIAVGYGRKHDELMAQMGTAKYSLPVQSFDVEELIRQFKDLSADLHGVSRTIASNSARSTATVLTQLDQLEEELFPSPVPVASWSG